jgi:hypothetical protein
MVFSANKAFILVALGFLLELGVFSFLRNEHRYYLLPMVWFTGGILGCIGIYLESTRSKAIPSSEKISNKSAGVIYLALALLFCFSLTKLASLHPIDPKNSDVIPTIQIMAQRVLNLEHVYRIVDYGWSFMPTYLPMKFLPYTIAELLGIDYRVFAYIVFAIIVYIVFAKVSISSSYPELVTKMSLSMVALMLIIKFNDPIFIHSVELLDAAYIILLVWSIFSDHFWLKVIAIVSCLLSRYGIVLWLPFFAWFYFLQYDKGKALKVLGYSVLGVMVLYVIPFMWKDPLMFFKSIKTYDAMAVPQWEQVPEWFSHVGKPYTLSQGFSFAIHWRDWIQADTMTKIQWFKNLQLGLVELSMFMAAWWYKRHKAMLNYEMFTFFTLKVFMTIFYGFLYVPYSYLYLVPLSVSIMALFVIPLQHKS